MKKILIIGIMAISFFILGNRDSLASDMLLNKEVVNYDIGDGGKQEFDILDEEGEESTITVEEVPSKERLASGAYKISKYTPGRWYSSYNISVVNNNISRVYSPYTQTDFGWFLRDHYLWTSSKKRAVYTVKCSSAPAISTLNLSATLQTNSISVSLY